MAGIGPLRSHTRYYTYWSAFVILQKNDLAKTYRRMNQESEEIRVCKWQLATGWALFLSYAVGSPIFVFVEARTGLFSERFNYPPEFLYLVSAAQFFCALVLFKRALAPWSAMVLTIITVGAVISHLRIGSAVAALPAVMYTVIQTWYGIRLYRQHQDKSA